MTKISDGSFVEQLQPFPLEEMITQYQTKLSRSSTIEYHYGKSTRFFNDADSEKLFQENMRDPEKRALLEINNWTADNIIYHCNDLGFRTDKPNIKHDDYEKGGVIYLGDSNVFGLGLNIEQSLTYIAHYNSKFKDLPYINLGQPGNGITGAQRVLRYNIEQLKPRYVVGLFHWSHSRQEFYYPDSLKVRSNYIMLNAGNLKPTREQFNIIFTPQQGIIRYVAGLEAIKWACHEHGVQLLWIEDEKTNKTPVEFTRSVDDNCKARDLMHWGTRTHHKMGLDLARIIDVKFGGDFD